jgi:NAD dependent epimerase/dehydratase family enzyme
VVNVAAPNPLPNRGFPGSYGRRGGFASEIARRGWILEIGTFLMRTESELVLKSRRIAPGRLLAAGFQFCFPEWAQVAEDLVAK